MIEKITYLLNKANKRPEKKKQFITTIPNTLKAEMYISCYKYFSPGRYALQNGLMVALEWFIETVKSEMSEEELIQFEKEVQDFLNKD